MTTTPIRKDLLESMFRDAMGINAAVLDVIKLHGDASYRTYYRVILDDKRTFVLMQMPAGKASVSEEITNFNGTHQELPFINVARFLENCGIRVPAIHHYSEGHHLMILRDLGDSLMARIVEKADNNLRREWYRRAIELLAALQRKTADADRSDCVALQRSFDQTLLNWEFDHFLEYGVEARLGIKMSKEDHEIFFRQTRGISEKIASLPYGFTHRDFQSRNILIVNDELYLIDFQDALLGPAAYDLAALLRDSYVELSEPILNELISFYCEKTGRKTSSFMREFDLVTCQRKLKDAGRFVFIDRVKKNPNFLKYIPASLGYVKQALERLPEYQSLYEMLKKYIPEWK